MSQEQPTTEPLKADEEWLEEQPDELPPRPRRRLLAPLPLALMALLLCACGFIAGVLVEKGQGNASSPTGVSGAAFASRLRGAGVAVGVGAASFARGLGGARAGAPASTGGFSRPTFGTVEYVQGDTLYVTDAEGTTVKVMTSPATSVTKSVKSSVGAIHPGETVTATGATGSNGALSAESITVGSAEGGLAALFGSGHGASGPGSGAGASGGGAEQALFGKGG